MNPIPISWMLLGTLGAFVAGAVTGGIGVHKWYKVSILAAQVKSYERSAKNLREALELTAKADLEDDALEKANDEVYERLIARLHVKPPVTGGEPVTEVGTGAVDPDPECVPSDVMRAIGEFK